MSGKRGTGFGHRGRGGGWVAPVGESSKRGSTTETGASLWWSSSASGTTGLAAAGDGKRPQRHRLLALLPRWGGPASTFFKVSKELRASALAHLPACCGGPSMAARRARPEELSKRAARGPGERQVAASGF